MIVERSFAKLSQLGSRLGKRRDSHSTKKTKLIPVGL